MGKHVYNHKLQYSKLQHTICIYNCFISKESTDHSSIVHANGNRHSNRENDKRNFFMNSAPSFFSLLFTLFETMVRFKNRWVLFQIVQDPVIEHGQVVYPRTAFEVTDSMISKTIFQSIELNYGHFGKGQGSVSGNCHAVSCARKGCILTR